MPWPPLTCATSSRFIPASTTHSTTTPASGTTRRRQPPPGTTRLPGLVSTSEDVPAGGTSFRQHATVLGPFQQHHDLVVRGLREHIQQADASWREGWYRGKVAGQGFGIAA